MAQVVECLPTMFKALSSNFSATEEKALKATYY
jgi:hypothetical protein